jgi:hypothetical protein
VSNVEADHAEAGLALLAAVPALTVYDGALPGSATDVLPPYVLVYTTVEWPDGDEDNSLDGLSGTCVTRWYCHCVGGTAAAARAVANQVRSALLDVRPPVPGRNCNLIRQDSALPPARDESLARVVMDAVVVYRLETRPA